MPGVLERVRSFFGTDPNRQLREQLERDRLIWERRMQRRLLREDGAGGFGGPNWIGAVVDPYEPLYDDYDFYNPMWGVEKLPPTLNKTLHGDLIPVYISWYGLKVIRDVSRKLCVQNEFAIGAIENRVSYICGRGFQHKLVPKNGRESPETKYLCALGQTWIDTFTSHQRWNEREQEVVRRCDRDGECFLRFFHVGHGHTEVRFIEPEWVQSPADNDWDSYGIVNEVGDIEKVLGYWIYEYPPYQKATYVSADEILHIKINGDSTSKRGLPTFYPIRKNLERAEKLLRNMSVLAQIQATFAMVRKQKQYSVAAIQQQQQATADFSYANPWGGPTKYAKGFAPGTILDIPENTDIEFPAVAVNAGNIVAVLNAELTAAGQRVNMPPFMFSGDMSATNLATAFVAESPFVKNSERAQSFYALRFGDGAMVDPPTSGAMWRVLANAVNYGGLPRRVLTDCELIVEGPTLIVRDKAQETQRAAMLNQAGRLSGATWAKWEGVDDEQEVKQWQEEQVRNTQFQIGIQKMQADAQLQIQMEQQQAQAALQQQQMAQQQAQMAAQGAAQGQQQQAGREQQLQALQQSVPPVGGQGPAQGGGMAPGASQGPPMPGQPMPQQLDLMRTPHSDSGFVSRQGGDMRDLLGLESVEEAARIMSLEDVQALRKLVEGADNAEQAS